jgi:Cys-tRNA(Pro)/Cys-tRNA(Cys) deacylase
VVGAVTPGLAALVKAGVPHEVFKFSHDSGESSFGAEAIHALTKTGSVAPEQIHKTLIVAVPNGFAVAILRASARLSLKAFAMALGAAKASLADRHAPNG